MTTYSDQKAQESDSRTAFAFRLSPFRWVVQKVEDPDVGEDLFVRIFDGKIWSGITFFVQFSSTIAKLRELHARLLPRGVELQLPKGCEFDDADVSEIDHLHALVTTGCSEREGRIFSGALDRKRLTKFVEAVEGRPLPCTVAIDHVTENGVVNVLGVNVPASIVHKKYIFEADASWVARLRSVLSSTSNNLIPIEIDGGISTTEWPDFKQTPLVFATENGEL